VTKELMTTNKLKKYLIAIRKHIYFSIALQKHLGPLE